MLNLNEKYSFKLQLNKIVVHQENECNFQKYLLKKRHLYFICLKKNIKYDLNDTFHFVKVFDSICPQQLPYILYFRGDL